MPSFTKWLGAAGLGVGLIVAAAPTAEAGVIYTASGTDSGGPISASADITLGSNAFTVALSSLINNPTSSAQEVSGIIITFQSGPSSVSFTSGTGTFVTIAADGTFTVAPNSSTTHWGAALSGGSVYVATAGTGSQNGQPTQLIIGDPSGGLYSNANKGIDNFNPEVLDTGFFTVSAPGISATSVISSVSFEFGTAPEATLTGTTPSTPTPEPTSLMLVASGLFGIGAFARRRMTKN